MFSIRARSLGKAYRIYDRPIESLKELLTGRSHARTQWAVRGVDFDVLAGGSIGIIGDNGAGKSTLLRLLAGAALPSEGRVERAGRVSALLQLGAGFHPDLSGRENIRIGCAVLGLSPGETAELLPAIVEFSELGPFIDHPLRTYSSGMSLRLGFAVATAMSPDILVVDEHLSVGDQHFRHKCMRRIEALRARGCTLAFCSHDMYAVGEVCERTLWLRQGRVAMLADTPSVLAAYQDHVRERDAASDRAEAPAQPPARPGGVHGTCIEQVELEARLHDGCVATGSPLAVRITARVAAQAWHEGVQVGLVIVRNDAVWCYGVSTKMDGLSQGLQPLGGDRYGIRFVIDALPLLSGSYSFTVALMDDGSPLVYDSRAGMAPFEVRHGGKDVGVAYVTHRWEPGG